MNSFVEWLQEEMNRRNLNQSDLARLGHIKPGTIGNILRGERKAGLEACKAIAKAFDLDPVEVLRIAGHIPTKYETDKVMDEAFYQMGFLNIDDKNEVLEFIKMKKQIAERRAQYG